MASPSKSAQLRFTLDSVGINAPIEWQDIDIEATFNDQAIQPNITSSDFTFVNAEALQIRNYIDNGLTGGVGIFEGVPFNIETFNKDSSRSAFDGFLDLSDDFEDLADQSKVKAKIMKENGLNSLNNRLSALTYGYLQEIKVFTDSDYTDVDYKVIKKVSVLEVLISSLTLFVLTKELIQSTRDITNDISNIIATTAAGLGGLVSGPLMAIVVVLADIIYLTAIIIAIIKLARELINLILPPTRVHKTIKWELALSKVANYLGYDFVSPIKELGFLHYLPSNPNLDEQDAKSGLLSKVRGTSTGLPNSQDYGYNCSEMFSLAQDTFNARFAIIGNELHLRSDNDPWWIKTATYQMPNVLIESKKYNTDDMRADRLLSFQIDIKDSWTTDNYLGTAYEVKTDAITVSNPRAVTLSGLDRTDLPIALGNRKDKLNALENLLLKLAIAADGISNAVNKSLVWPFKKKVGVKSNLAGSIRDKKGVLKVSENDTSIPKLLYLVNKKLPLNHRELFSAKSLWNDYHFYNSFVDDNFIGQKEVYENIEIPFGFEDFLKLIDNSYFLNFKGEVSKATELKWNIASDKAIISFWTRKPYTKNLRETKIEPS